MHCCKNRLKLKKKNELKKLYFSSFFCYFTGMGNEYFPNRLSVLLLTDICFFDRIYMYFDNNFVPRRCAVMLRLWTSCVDIEDVLAIGVS